MKLVSFKTSVESSFGLIENEIIFDLKKFYNQKYLNLKDFICSEDFLNLEKLKENFQSDYESTDVIFEPVITNPDHIICVGLNYKTHVDEVNEVGSLFPLVFLRTPQSQVGHNGNIVCPTESNHIDYEGEIAVIISKDGRRIAEKDAKNFIAGFAIYNDASIRDWQLHNSQWIPGKNFPNTGAFGPWMTTYDAINHNEPFELITKVNGEVKQKTTSNLLIHSIDKLISYISTFLNLRAGDVIVTGTPGGVGFAKKPPEYLKDGDEIEVSVSQLGVLINKIKYESK